jgi:DNA-binding HxlR family transcriptional regulator
MAVLAMPNFHGDQYARDMDQLVAALSMDARFASVPLPHAMRAIDAPPPEPITWLVQDLWTAGEIGLIVGDGGAFKSSAALHMAAAIAGGYQVFGKFRTQQRPVLIVSAEDSASVILMRLEAFIVGHGWDRTLVLSNIHFFAQDDVSLASVKWQQHLLSEVQRVGAGFVVLDPMAELIDGDENSNTDVRPVIKFVRSLTAATGASVAMVHHAGKAGPEKRTLDRIRGASALPHSSRVILFFEFQAAGVRVENLKMSRAERLEPFVLERTIEHEPGNRAMWTSARLGYANAKRVERDRSEAFILTQLRLAQPERLTTTRLRTIARDVPGIRNEELASALNRLTAMDLIDRVAGEKNKALWGLTALGKTVDPQLAHEVWATRAHSNSELAQLAQRPGNQRNGSSDDACVPPLGGDGKLGRAVSAAGQPESQLELERPIETDDDRGEAWEPELDD